jgi:DNA gyrase subunit A
MVVTISHRGYIKRNPVSLYRAQRRGGKGKTGMAPVEEDFVEDLFVASTHANILFFTTRGKAYCKKVHEIPQAGRAAKGKAIVNFLPLEQDERVQAILPIREFEADRFIVMATKNGLVKKTDLMAYCAIRSSGIIAIKVDDGDELIAAAITDGRKEIFLSTLQGKSVRFKEEEVRSTGRATMGVKGMSLAEGDHVVSMEIINPRSTDATILTVCENGYGKRTRVDEYPIQHRGGSGVITIKTTERNGQVVKVYQVTDDDNLMIITDTGRIIRLRIADISVIGRNTQGVRLINVDPGEKAGGVCRLMEQEDENGEAGAEAESAENGVEAGEAEPAEKETGEGGEEGEKETE